MTVANASRESADWIPAPFQLSAQNLARDAVKKFARAGQVVGLGSGPMAAAIVRCMSEMNGKETLECVATSYQIKLEAQCRQSGSSGRTR